jgi:hypothetical protein
LAIFVRGIGREHSWGGRGFIISISIYFLKQPEGFSFEVKRYICLEFTAVLVKEDISEKTLLLHILHGGSLHGPKSVVKG